MTEPFVTSADVPGVRLDDLRPRRSLLVGVPGSGIEGAAVGQPGLHGGQHLGWLGHGLHELHGEHPGRLEQHLPATVHQRQPGDRLRLQPGHLGGHHGTQPMAGDDGGRAGHRLAPASAGHDGEHIEGQGLQAVARQRCIGSAMTAQVRRDDRVPWRQAAGHRQPCPGGAGQAVDEHDGPARLASRPVQVVEPLARLEGHDHRLGRLLATKWRGSVAHGWAPMAQG